MRQTQWFAKNTVLSTDQIVAAAPAVAAPHAASRVSERYGFIPTLNVVEHLHNAGFQCVGVQQSRTRFEDRQGYQRHVPGA